MDVDAGVGSFARCGEAWVERLRELRRGSSAGRQRWTLTARVYRTRAARCPAERHGKGCGAMRALLGTAFGGNQGGGGINGAGRFIQVHVAATTFVASHRCTSTLFGLILPPPFMPPPFGSPNWASLLNGQRVGGSLGKIGSYSPVLFYDMLLARLGMGEGEMASTSSAGSKA